MSRNNIMSKIQHKRHYHGKRSNDSNVFGLNH